MSQKRSSKPHSPSGQTAPEQYGPPAPQRKSQHVGAHLRNYFLAGLVVVGPITITLYITWWFIEAVDAWVKPFVPAVYDPETYLKFAVPGFGLLFSVILLTLIGALAANLFGRAFISSSEMFLDRMPIVRNIYRGLKQFFESVAIAAAPGTGIAQVGLIEFPSKGIWSLVYVTTDATDEIKNIAPGGETDLVMVWMPTGFMPPTGFTCVVPRKDVILLSMSAEDAAKIIASAGMVSPEQQSPLQQFVSTVDSQPVEMPPSPTPPGSRATRDVPLSGPK